MIASVSVFRFWTFMNSFSLLSLTITATKRNPIHRGERSVFSFLNIIPQEGFRLSFPPNVNNITTRTRSVYDVPECASFCLDNLWCFSANYKKIPESNGTHLCESLGTDVYSNPKFFGPNNDSVHLRIQSSCEEMPCLNNGTCIPFYENNTYRCECKRGWSGQTCANENSYRRLTCSTLKSNDNSLGNGTYVIDPESAGVSGSFSVYCDMTGDGVTVVSHDTEARIHVNGYRLPGTYVTNVTYSASLAQLSALISASISCEQYIKYECFDSRLFRSHMGWWVSRDGRRMDYWGGATPGSNSCACGLTSSCAQTSHKCNCDKNDNVWREDNGLLQNKADLPVTQLRFGDTGYSNSDAGYHTLGKLKCRGRVV